MVLYLIYIYIYILNTYSCKYIYIYKVQQCVYIYIYIHKYIYIYIGKPVWSKEDKISSSRLHTSTSINIQIDNLFTSLMNCTSGVYNIIGKYDVVSSNEIQYNTII